ncbi:Oidioi.mRNA.OKI2018_I69.chr2.g5700.t1.cds [Oikopleura dioica]|uniref:Oidioi.mRNA.OKI2018_I69.chr2.g5700.t1.cds n=1 Tax=Oikopleura dioica TaxID=34765 RepID=A0ABN7T5I7_OIKDI|nr:Oidioi.mRNA.OKI2018_I69.chr2.g5700.t1.cds [Oikopleura dioica]
MPEPLRASFYDFKGLRHLVQKRVEELRAGEEDDQLKRSNELIAQYDNHNHDLPPFNKINSPQWWRNLPVEVRKELIHERCPPEKIEKWGIGSINARIIDLLVKYDVTIRDDGEIEHQKQIVVIHNTTPTWWRNLQSDVKIRILNKGHGWHDLYPNEVKAVRAASQLLHLPHRLNEWLDAAPQEHALTLVKFNILNDLQKQSDFQTVVDHRKDRTGGQRTGDDGEAKNTLHILDQSGNTQGKTPITIWAPNKSDEKFEEYEFTTEQFARNLQSDQILLKDQSKGPKIMIDISANVDELEIDNALVDEEMIAIEEEITDLLAKPMPRLLGFAVAELVGGHEIPRYEKYDELLANPTFTKWFVKYITESHKDKFRDALVNCNYSDYVILLSSVRDEEDGENLIRTFFEIVNDSILWPQFGLALTEAMSARGDVSQQLIKASLEPDARRMLSAIISVNKEFELRFGAPENPEAFANNPKYAEFFLELIESDSLIFIDILKTMASRGTNRGLFKDLIAFLDDTNFNENLFIAACKNEEGANCLRNFVNLTSKKSPWNEILTDLQLLRSEGGRGLHQSFNYEADTASVFAQSSITILHRGLDKDIEKVAKRIVDTAESLTDVFGSISNFRASLENLQKIASKPTKRKAPKVSAGINPLGGTHDDSESEEYENVGVNTLSGVTTVRDMMEEVEKVILPKPATSNFSLMSNNSLCEDLLKPSAFSPRKKKSIFTLTEDSERLASHINPKIFSTLAFFKTACAALSQNFEDHLAVDYAAIRTVGKDAAKLFLSSGEDDVLDNIMNLRNLFQSLDQIRESFLGLDPSIEGEKSYVPKELGGFTAIDLQSAEVFNVFELIADSLEEIYEAVSKGDLVGKWWFRVFNRLDLNDCTHADIVRELIFGSCLERYRNCPSNQLIIRELKIRFERTLKLLDTVGVELRKFSRAAAKVEEELRRDFVTGNTVTIQTETSAVTSRPEIHQLKSLIEQATQGTDTSSGPSLMSFQDRINDLQNRVMQNLCGAAKLMMLEDQPVSFEETDSYMDDSPFKRAPFPRSRSGFADLAAEVADKYSKKTSKKYKLRPKARNLIKEHQTSFPAVVNHAIDFVLFLVTCGAMFLIFALESANNEDQEKKIISCIFALATILLCEIVKVFVLAALSGKSTALLGRVQLEIFY